MEDKFNGLEDDEFEEEITLTLIEFEHIQWQNLKLSLVRPVECDVCHKELRNDLWLKNEDYRTAFLCDACYQEKFKNIF